MKRKKHFVSPRVLCQVEVCLEGDLLGIGVGTSTEYEMEVINDSFRFKCNHLLNDLLGHENISTTRIYLRKSSLEQRTLIEQIVDW